MSQMNNIINTPTDDMYCPITYQLMIDPVMDPEGYTYEREAIVNWLRSKSESPFTRNPLHIDQLIPNRALKSAIDQIRDHVDQSQLIRKTELSERCSSEMISILQNSLNNIKSQIFFNNSNSELHLKLSVPNSETRAPIHVCLVIDVSGSMATEATMKGADGRVESHGFSLLDIVKQAAHAVRVTLTDIDALSIVKYSSTADVILTPTQMNDSGKNQAESSINHLHTEGQTNIWDGLNKALDICRLNKTDGRNDKVILLTDGQPNVVPPRGHVGMLNKYKDQHAELPASIDTFGFGYNLDSKDLNSISVTTNGNYGFIPDSSMVGDLFSNAIANFMATAVTNATISFELENGVKLDNNPIMGNYQIESTSWGGQIETGPLYYGQDKDFILKLQNTNSIYNSITVTTRYNHFGQVKEDICSLVTTTDQSYEIQKIRLQTVEAIYMAYDQMRFGNKDVAEATIKSMIQILSTSQHQPIIKDILTDLTEQVSIAISKSEYFEKWGKHYLPSLARAHQQQICNNFRDPGVQHYGGSLFKKMRDIADDKFTNLPAPTPTARSSHGYRSMGPSSGSLRVATLASYNSHSGPCFTGDSLVKMQNGLSKRVDQMTKGDKVITFDKNNNTIVDEVECILKTNLPKKTAPIVTLPGGWKGTATHPVKMGNTWFNAKSLCRPENTMCLAVYSFLLKDRNTIIINDIESATFAHNLTDNDVIQHDYFGTDKVIDDFKNIPGWKLGLIEIEPKCIFRDSSTGYVTRIIGLNSLNYESH